MTENQAERDGLEFKIETGDVAYTQRDLDRLKKRANDIRKAGYRAVVVKGNVSDWGAGARLLYVDPDYSLYEEYINLIGIPENFYVNDAFEKGKLLYDHAVIKQKEVERRIKELTKILGIGK